MTEQEVRKIVKEEFEKFFEDFKKTINTEVLNAKVVNSDTANFNHINASDL